MSVILSVILSVQRKGCQWCHWSVKGHIGTALSRGHSSFPLALQLAPISTRHVQCCSLGLHHKIDGWPLTERPSCCNNDFVMVMYWNLFYYYWYTSQFESVLNRLSLGNNTLMNDALLSVCTRSKWLRSHNSSSSAVWSNGKVFHHKFTTYSRILTISCSNTKVFLLHCSFSTHVIVHTRMLYHQALICLQCYSQSRQPHGSWPFHDFAWYNSWNSHELSIEPAAGMAPGGGSNQEEWLPAALWIALLMSICAFLRATQTEQKRKVSLRFFLFSHPFPLLGKDFHDSHYSAIVIVWTNHWVMGFLDWASAFTLAISPTVEITG